MARNGRGWGPFSGGQLTTIIVAIAVVAGFPFAAGAVTPGTSVFVTDPTSAVQAKVSTAGALNVSGSVSANNASPMNLYQLYSNPGASVWNLVAAPPTGKALIITSVVVDTSSVTPALSQEVIFDVSTTDASCATVGSQLVHIHPATIGATTIPIPSGFVIPAKRALCAEGTHNIISNTFVYGYLVPAGTAPPGS